MSHGADILAGEIDIKQLARQLLLNVYVIAAKTVSTHNREISYGLGGLGCAPEKPYLM